jgi:hypothetical protein
MDKSELLVILLSWAAHLSSYSYPEDPPDYRFEPHSFFVEHACGGNTNCNTGAWYNNDGVIYLDDRLQDWADPMVRSVIVHELIHYLQDISGKFNKGDCEEQLVREREAYAIQRIYINRIAGVFAATFPVYAPCPEG